MKTKSILITWDSSVTIYHFAEHSPLPTEHERSPFEQLLHHALATSPKQRKIPHSADTCSQTLSSLESIILWLFVFLHVNKPGICIFDMSSLELVEGKGLCWLLWLKQRGSENGEILSGLNVIQQESGVNCEKSEWVSLASVQDADSPRVGLQTFFSPDSEELTKGQTTVCRGGWRRGKKWVGGKTRVWRLDDGSNTVHSCFNAGAMIKTEPVCERWK